MFLSKILIHSFMVINYIAEDNIFVASTTFSFSAAEILIRTVNDWFEIKGKIMIKTPRKVEYVRFRNYERKTKLLFIIYADFESILVPQDNGRQNPDEYYMNKYNVLPGELVIYLSFNINNKSIFIGSFQF